MIVKAVGSEFEEIKKVPLHELDHNLELDNLMSIYVPPIKQALRHNFSDFKQTIATLRGPEGCQWDKKQTHMSLRQYLLEESYELIEAINNNDDENIIEELGDILLQVMLHSQIGEDEGYFTIDDVIKTVNEKMIRRHPHVFDKTIVHSVEEINANWEVIKAAEKGNKTEESALDNILESLPALLKTTEIIKKAKKSGFDWENVAQLWDKLSEELTEFKEAVSTGNMNEMELELGDVLFVMTDLAHYYKINPEVALLRVNDKFISRFQSVELGAKTLYKSVLDLTEEEKDLFWNRLKKRSECMRLDKFLKISRLIKRRPLAKQVADQGRIKINDLQAKASSNLEVGDQVEIKFGQTTLTIEIVELKDHVNKNEATNLYKILKEERVE